AELAGVERRSVMILHQPNGKPFTPGRLGDWMARAIEKAGLPTECVLHGLRKSAAAALAEAGCSEREIMAITGHRTPQMVSLYTRSADQKRLAKSAMAKREKDEP
ncbi:MAG: tyrosine-type recombinase/integrase, partial [Alsobacter sp.]